VERIVHKSQSFEEADAWDASQQRAMSPNERMRAAKEIRDRVFPGPNPDIREWQATAVRVRFQKSYEWRNESSQ
jgi:hypothetical protein